MELEGMSHWITRCKRLNVEVNAYSWLEYIHERQRRALKTMQM